MTLTARMRRYAFDGHFTIARGSRTHVEVVEVAVTRNGVTGFGECVPYARYGESVESVLAAITALPEDVSLEALQTLLPEGAARNGVDCALWDLAAKTAGQPVHELLGLPAPEPLTTAFTLSLDTPEAMRAKAAANAARPVLKIKLGTPDDLPRLRAVREGAPKSDLILDANEGWTPDSYRVLIPQIAELGVKLIEQPLPAGQDAALRDLPRPVPICADESCHGRATLADLAGKYDVINIKLDKTGGLTEALALKAEAERQGFGIMVGCMAASSLAMAPAVLVAQGAAFVDLDGPLLLAEDHENGLRYEQSRLIPASPALWG
ncbi:N-acetyl-D-Glu racemase DgcA [Paracoccus aminophilus]|uniref:Dipeptide epimerase n=1 Tax=Paracoccus aminophilus JCM 7686 TaxID=1367847 RepID=S5Y379_PARAH|nr:N-acetyl-D-Glu racemase DgcA [Paracoccus aminophilus]AGT10205.1 mandelate racemase/muconate lactonizing enzyme family protein [Paracoccus aminophilus JCM 7686]